MPKVFIAKPCYGLLFGMLFSLALGACTANNHQQTPSPTLAPLVVAIEITATPQPSYTPSITPTTTEPLVTETPIQTEAPAAIETPSPEPNPSDVNTDETAEPTDSASIAITVPSPTPGPSLTPYPSVAFLNDQWQQVTVPSRISIGLDRDWIAFANYNDPTRVQAEADDPDQAINVQTLYLTHPANRQRVRVADIPAAAGNRIFWSPTARHVLYYVDPSLVETGGGLFMLDLVVGLDYRLLDISSLNPRGILGHEPIWSADGSRFTLALATDYATDVFIINADGTNFRNFTQNASYDLWPSISPDNVWVAFVSDRQTCPSYAPDAPNTCAGAPPPRSGNLFIQNLNTGELRQITDVQVSSPPRWITVNRLAFVAGEGDLLAENSEIWLVDVAGGSAVRVSPPNAFSIAPSWTNDAELLAYQRITDRSQLVIANRFGGELASSEAFIFPRFGLAADWSADGEFLALGGRDGRCPYGIIILSPSLSVITPPVENLLACDPLYAPSGTHLAFMGNRPSLGVDSKLDVYVANPNGLGAANVTLDLRGELRLLGWVGPTPPDLD